MQRTLLASRLLLIPLVASVTIGCGQGCASSVPAPNNNGTVTDPDSDGVESISENGYQLAIHREPYGETAEGLDVDRFLLSNEKGMQVTVITFGATVTSVEVPDKNGEFTNVTLGFGELKLYENNPPYFGVICGRYANRIAKGKFTLDDVEYQLEINNAPNHLHGGKYGFNKGVWQAEPKTDDDAVNLTLTYRSPDGEEKYPGEVTAQVTYTLTNNNELKIEYAATTTKPTPINLTNHCYWNLAGSGDVLDYQLMLNCDRYLPVDDTLIPTGELKSVKDSPMDFTAPRTIGSRIAEVGGGYDHCYVINREDNKPVLVARVSEPNSGRVMEVYSTEPGVQLYTGNFLDGSRESGGFEKYSGFCLECQHFPDSPNQPEFPNTILRPGKTYRQTTVHKFLVEE